MKQNKDNNSIKSFGNEWSRFDQSNLTDIEVEKIFNEYFLIFPWEKINNFSIGFDMGCGTGRWARLIAKKVGHLHCIDPSFAINIAKKNLSSFNNISYHQLSVDENPLPDNSQDFGYSLGVLHHVPNTATAISDCVKFLKPGAPILLYLYYSFENRNFIYKFIWKCSNILRLAISKLPEYLKNIVTDFIACIIYFPLARISLLLENFNFKVNNIPLSYYRMHSFYTMRTDSRDRFGTPLEHRFTKFQINDMMIKAGLKNIKFSSNAPFWCVIGYKK
jgi:ubiquinone/menaquinone biosynthesis C-methylase UbiE